jgi:hypothetical protein
VTSPVVPAARRRRLELLAGAALALLACLGVPWVADVLGSRVALTPALPASVVLVTGLVLRRDPRTRGWGTGLLLGLAVAVALAAVGLVVLVQVFGG